MGLDRGKHVRARSGSSKSFESRACVTVGAPCVTVCETVYARSSRSLENFGNGALHVGEVWSDRLRRSGQKLGECCMQVRDLVLACVCHVSVTLRADC